MALDCADGLFTSEIQTKMEILKKQQRDYLVASCPAISQNIYMYPRAGKVIETAGQLGSCPQKVLAANY